MTDDQRILALDYLRQGDRQEMIYPQIDLSTNATKGKNGSCGAFVGHLPRIESWKAP